MTAIKFDDKMARKIQGIAHLTRLQILEFLSDGEKTVDEIVKHIGTSQGNISQHLIMMRDRGILENRKEANNMYYALKNPKLVEAIDKLVEALMNSPHALNLKPGFYPTTGTLDRDTLLKTGKKKPSK